MQPTSLRRDQAVAIRIKTSSGPSHWQQQRQAQRRGCHQRHRDCDIGKMAQHVVVALASDYDILWWYRISDSKGNRLIRLSRVERAQTVLLAS